MKFVFGVLGILMLMCSFAECYSDECIEFRGELRCPDWATEMNNIDRRPNIYFTTTDFSNQEIQVRIWSYIRDDIDSILIDGGTEEPLFFMIELRKQGHPTFALIYDVASHRISYQTRDMPFPKWRFVFNEEENHVMKIIQTTMDYYLKRYSHHQFARLFIPKVWTVLSDLVDTTSEDF